jgi:hypothetical protein
VARLPNLISYGILVWSTLSPPALAQHICWIKSVVKTTYGVDIYLSQSRKVFLYHAELSQPYDVTPTSALRAVLGDKFLSVNTPEDTCSGEVVERSGAIGVEVNAAFHPPGLPGVISKDFIAAEPAARQ